MPRLTGRTAFINAKLILTKMFELSKEVPATQAVEYGFPVTDPDETVRLFIGHVKVVAQEVGVGSTTISHATALAKAMRCMTLLRGGGPGSNTVYIMHYMPTDDDFEKYRDSRDQTSSRVAPNSMQRYENELAAVRIQQKELRLALDDLRRSFEDFKEVTFLERDNLIERIRTLENDSHNVRGSETLS